MLAKSCRLFGSLLFLTLASPLFAETPDPSFAEVNDTPNLPRVLILGDSISMGYTIPVRKLLDGKANVHRPADNCGPSNHLLAELDKYLGDGHWDVITLNCGLHDIVFMNEKGERVTTGGKHQVALDDYQANLEKILDRLQKTGATIIWNTTTPVGKQAKARHVADVGEYNAAAEAIMKKHNITICDLNALVAAGKAQQRKDGVHYEKPGYNALAAELTPAIEKALTEHAKK